MEIEFSDVRWSQDDAGFWLELKLTDPQRGRAFIEEKQEGDYIFKPERKTDKRTLDANGYFWYLCDKLAVTIGMGRSEVYKNLVKEIGGNSVIVPIKEDAKDEWIKNWQSRGLGWICEVIGTSKLEGYVNIVNYYGSSVYNKAQMSRLIDLIVRECELQDIDVQQQITLTRQI